VRQEQRSQVAQDWEILVHPHQISSMFNLWPSFLVAAIDRFTYSNIIAMVKVDM
jgi:hypothetical protein